MAQLATRGAYDAGAGELVPGGEPRCYVASDNLKHLAYRSRTPAAAIEAIEAAGFAFDRQTLTGVTLACWEPFPSREDGHREHLEFTRRSRGPP